MADQAFRALIVAVAVGVVLAPGAACQADLSKQYNDQGCEAWSNHDYDRAEKLFHSALTNARTRNDLKRVETAASNLVRLYEAQGKSDQASQWTAYLRRVQLARSASGEPAAPAPTRSAPGSIYRADSMVDRAAVRREANRAAVDRAFEQTAGWADGDDRPGVSGSGTIRINGANVTFGGGGRGATVSDPSNAPDPTSSGPSMPFTDAYDNPNNSTPFVQSGGTPTAASVVRGAGLGATPSANSVLGGVGTTGTTGSAGGSANWGINRAPSASSVMRSGGSVATPSSSSAGRSGKNNR